jgi:heat shock protein HslJ
LFGALAVFVLGGCGENAPSQSAGLDGRVFLSESVSGETLVAGTQIRIAFAGEQVSVSAGCNTLGAGYRIEDGHLVVHGGVSSTEMGCDEARHAQDEWLAAFLQATPRIVVTDTTATLSTTKTTIRLTDRHIADPDRPLAGTQWHVDTIMRNGTASSAVEANPVVLVFGAESLTATATDCTSAVVPTTLDASAHTLQFGDFAVDAIGCGEQWDATLEVLRSGTVTYAIEANRLTLTAGGIGVAAVAN